VDAIISELIQEDYLNEERFARSFARGKFRMKQWGRVKIKYELKQRQVSEYCIKKGLTEIDDDEYDKTLNNLIEQKSKTLKSEKNMFVKKRKLLDYLLQKGFERDIALSAMSESK
jgi:regulatory protein